MDVNRLMTAATAYIERGWYVFTVSESKIPWANCDRCAPGAHGGIECSCLSCHGHLAGTRDVSRVRAMIWGRGGNCRLALDCGRSGLVVIDAEGDDRSGVGMTGLEALDQVESFTGGRGLPATELRAVTGSGGVHLFYTGTARSANRVLPNVDMKAGGGFVVVPPAEGRNWLSWTGEPGTWDPELFADTATRASGGGASTGGPLRDRVVDGIVPAGERYEYTRNLVYKLRKRDVSRAEAEEVMRREWSRYAQPPSASSVLPWSQVLYELDRCWARVQPERLSATQQAWINGMSKRKAA